MTHLIAYQLAPASYSINAEIDLMLPHWHSRLALFSYYSLAQMLTVGYSDITPVSAPATTLSLLGTLFGMFYTAIVVSQFVGLSIVGELARPERQSFGADADSPQIRQLGDQQGLDVRRQVLRRHDQRVATGEQHVGHVRMAAQVGDQLVHLTRGELQLVHADELRPTETEAAVCVAGLPLTRKEEDRFAVLVLHPRQGLAFEQRHVVFELPCRMRVEAKADATCGSLYRRRIGTALQQAGNFVEVLGAQHVALREGESEHRIVGYAIPVDELLYHVVVGLERQHVTDDLDLESEALGKSVDLRNAAEVGE